MKELITFRQFLAEGKVTENTVDVDKMLAPIASSYKPNYDATVGDALINDMIDVIELDKLSGDYLADKYNFEDYRTLDHITPENVRKALDTLEVINVTGGTQAYRDLDLGGLGETKPTKEYALINYNNNTYLSSAAGKYVTQLK